jgi:hypothetical protein
MLVCNVSLRPPRMAIAATIAEAAAANATASAGAVFEALVDDPASATDILAEYLGEFLSEAASAADSFSTVGTFDAEVIETAAADSAQDGAVLSVSGRWTLVGSWTHSVNVPYVDFIGLAGYTEIRVLTRLLTTASGGTRSLRVSTDNGSTFLSSSGSYISVADAGDEVNATFIPTSALTSAARSGEVWFKGWNLTDIKIAQIRHHVTGSTRQYLIPTSSPLNAVRIIDLTAGDLTGGSIYVFAR